MPHSPPMAYSPSAKPPNISSKSGYRILGKNVNYPRIRRAGYSVRGQRDNCLCRSEISQGQRVRDPLESITKPKMRKLIKAASMYLAGNRLEDMPARFDVVSVTDLGIGHIENAFYGDFI